METEGWQVWTNGMIDETEEEVKADGASQSKLDEFT